MWQRVLKRILWFIPTLFIITLVGFLLLAHSPGDPVIRVMSTSHATNRFQSPTDIAIQKKYWNHRLGLDLPLFYGSITTLSRPDTLYKINNPNELKIYHTLIDQTGNALAINRYFKAIESCKTHWQNIISDHSHAIPAKWATQIDIQLDALPHQTDFEQQIIQATILSFYTKKITGYLPACMNELKEAIIHLKNDRTIFKNYIPKFSWYGTHNQYHHWLFGGAYSKGMLRGDFGISYVTQEPIIDIIKDRVIWSLFFSITSILLAYAISIPIGIKIAEKPHSYFSKISQVILFLLYAMPSFFIGVLLLMVFCNPEVVSILPSSGIKPIEGYEAGASLAGKFMDSLPYMILPLICYTYSSLAFISQLTATALNEELKLDYIKTAKAKGLTDKQVIRQHALKNTLLPLITVFSSVFPTIIGGSVIIESLFTIPGMGLETVRAIISHDYPMVIAILMISTFLTLVSYLVADILYAWVDPRIRN